MKFIAITIVLFSTFAISSAAPSFSVFPRFETDPVSSEGDAADDLAVWIHPQNPRQGLLVATDKKSGLLLYSLAGKKIAEQPLGLINNVDSRAGVTFGNEKIHLLAGSDRSQNSILLLTVDPRGPRLVVLGRIPLAYVPYGICMAAPDEQGAVSIFVTTKEGLVDRWEIKSNARRFEPRHVSSFKLSSKTEGCVFDDVTQQLFVSEEARGLWRADLRLHPPRLTLLDAVAPKGHLVADVEGVAIARENSRRGYVVVSSQGDSSYHVYEVESGRYRGRFQVAANAQIDGVTHTDGIEILSPHQSSLLPGGAFFAQDDENDSATGKQNQNFKAVDWPQIKARLGLE